MATTQTKAIFRGEDIGGDELMTKKETREAIKELKTWLVKWTKCDIQSVGFPCGTCTCNFLGLIGLNPKEEAYTEHNSPVDRANEVWRAILQIRELLEK